MANKPNVWNIENLLPNTNYIMYIGGLNQSDTLLKHIKISTLPNNPKYSLNCLMGYKGRVDRVTPGDIDIWRSLEYTAVNTIVSNDVDGKSESKSIPDEHVSSNTIYNQSSVHYMMHLGDFLSIEDILRKGSLELLDAVIRYDTSESLWVDLLDQLEVDVRNAYRKALSNPVLANLFRHCGHIFLCGASEAGMATTSFLAMLPTRQTPLSDSATGQTERADNTSGLKSVSASRGSLVSGARSGISTATSTANRSSSASGSRSASRSGSPAKSPSKAAQAAKLALQRKKLAKQEAAMENEENEDEDEEKNVEDEGEKQESFVEMDEESEVESEDDEVPEDHIIPMVGNLVRKEKEKLYKSVISHTAAQEELRHLITAAVVRLSRRVHYAYMRQLWDSVHYDAFVKQDEHDEVIHRKVMLLDSSTWC